MCSSDLNALEKAIAHFHGQAGLARALDVKPMRVHQWTRRKVPPEWCAKIEKASGGVVTCHELRPDIFDAPSAAA